MSRTFAALTIASDAVIAPNKPATSSNPSESFTMPPPDVYFFDVMIARSICSFSSAIMNPPIHIVKVSSIVT